MPSLADALYQLKYNPFKYGEHLTSFYSTLRNVDENLLLSQLIIPLCSHQIFSKKLSNANIRSSTWTIFKNRSLLYDLQERIDDMKILTEQSLNYCLVNDWLEVHPSELSIVCSSDIPKNYTEQKNAKNLGKLFSNLSVVEIFAFLGVKP